MQPRRAPTRRQKWARGFWTSSVGGSSKITKDCISRYCYWAIKAARQTQPCLATCPIESHCPTQEDDNNSLPVSNILKRQPTTESRVPNTTLRAKLEQHEDITRHTTMGPRRSSLRVVADAIEQHAAAVVSDGEISATGREIQCEWVPDRGPLCRPVGEGRARRRVNDLQRVSLLVGGDREHLGNPDVGGQSREGKRVCDLS